MLEWCDEYLAIADLAGFGAVDNRLDDFFHAIIGDRNFDFRFRQEIDNVFGAAVKLRMPALPAKSFDFANGHALHANLT